MVSLHPGGICEPCEDKRHQKCLGWKGPGLCGCNWGLCGLRLITGVMWDVVEDLGGTMSYAFIQARNYTPGRRKQIRLIVWHDMEAPEASTTAENVARWFAGSSAPKASAHVCVDDDSAVECVRLVDTAWHAPNANSDGAGIELAGRRDQGNAGWRDTFSLATISRACRWIVDKPALAHIPDRWLTDAQLADGVSAGHTTHEQVTRVLKGGTHTDPGPDFPRGYVLEQLAQLRGTPLKTAGKVPAWYTRPHKLGDVDQEVASIRKRLKLTVGVTFDKPLDAAVRYVQRAHHLEVDGIVGPDTAKAIG